jgi:hypothetical protein
MIYLEGQNLQIAITILALLALTALIWNFVLHRKFKRLVRGSKKGSIEDSILNIYKYIESANQESEKVGKMLKTLKAQMQKTPRGFGTVNFKAFDGVRSGGSNSFAVAFVNDIGDGIIISTFHARDRVNVFSKEIKEFKSQVELTDEETQALTKAKESLS